MSNKKRENEDCNVCGRRLTSWERRLSKSLGYWYPVCEGCIAREYDMDVEVLRERMEDFYGMRPCQGL